jgi:hypothetical protein
MTALQLREEVARLEAERALPISAGIDKAHAYMADLEEELEICRSAFVVEAVVETRRCAASCSVARSADAAAPNRTSDGRLPRPGDAS